MSLGRGYMVKVGKDLRGLAVGADTPAPRVVLLFVMLVALLLGANSLLAASLSDRFR